MKHIIQSLLTAISTWIVAAAVLHPTQALGAREPQPGDDRGRNRGGVVKPVVVEQRAEGRVSSVDAVASIVTLGSPVTGAGQFLVGVATKIRINGLRATLQQVNVGDRAEVRYDAATRLATKIEIVR